MVITRTELVEMIAGAVRSRLHELASDPDDDEERPDDADEPRAKGEIGNLENDPVANPKDRAPKKGPIQPEPDLSSDAEPEPSSEDQAADERDALDVRGDAGDDPTGRINDAVSGKTVQSVTLEPKSKQVPGAKEVVLSWNETTDELRIAFMPVSGKISFIWRGKTHDLP